MISVTLFSDPACPWGYSANPALRAIEWRYGDQLDWRIVLVGLSEDVSRYAEFGFTPQRMASSGLMFRERYGMPFAVSPKPRLSASSRACRAVIAARREWPGSEWRVFRTLQLANFNSALLFDDDQQMRAVLASVPGVDADRIVDLIDDAEVLERVRTGQARRLVPLRARRPSCRARPETATAAVRYTAPSLLFETSDGRRLEAGGFQPVEAYDVVIANLEPTLERQAPPEDPGPLLEYFDFGLTTQEVAAVMARGNDRPDRLAAETALIELVADGRAERHALGDDALWSAPGHGHSRGLAAVGSALAA